MLITPDRQVNMTLPGFLIIGAMKAGTTTLYEDLRVVPELYLPPEKEPNDLAFAKVETPEGLSEYAKKFNGAPAGTMAGEASTAYAKRPTHEGVAARACRLLGPKLKVIYLVRDPVRRIISQYRHLVGLGLENRPIDEAISNDETYLAYSLYEWQLSPWRDLLPEPQILVVSMERYVRDDGDELDRIFNFLNVEQNSLLGATSHRNVSAGKSVVREGSRWRKISTSPFYLYKIKPMLSSGARDRLKSILLPQAAAPLEDLAPETEQRLLESLAEDRLAGKAMQWAQ